MLPCGIKYTANVNQPFSVQLQGFNCRPSCRCYAYDQDEAIVPSEVVGPALSPGMVERDFFTTDRILPFYSRIFMVVAPLAGQSKVFQNGFSAPAERSDVFN